MTYVLKGGQIGFPTARVAVRKRSYKLSAKRWLTRPEGTITINVPDLSFDQLRRLYRTWQQDCACLSSTSGITAGEQKVLSLVERYGKPPGKRTHAAGNFWRTIFEAGCAEGFPWKSYHAPMVTYSRVLKKLGRKNEAAHA